MGKSGTSPTSMPVKELRKIFSTGPEPRIPIKRDQAWRIKKRKNRIRVAAGLAKPIGGVAKSTYRIKMLSKQQRHAIWLMSDLGPNRPTRAFIAQTVGVAPLTLTKWRNDPLFIQELNKEITKKLNFAIPEAFKHVYKKVKNGDMSVIFKYLKMTGHLKEVMEVTHKEQVPTEQLNDEIKRLQNELGAELTTEPETSG